MSEPKPETQAKKAHDEVQSAFDEAAEKGYFGETFDPHPNSAYSVQSGPDSPPLVPDNRTRADLPQAPPDPGTKS